MPLRTAPAVTNDVVSTFNIYASNAGGIWQTANLGLYLRSIGSGLITKIGVHVITSSGNISLAVYQGSGVGRARVPGARIATTGAVACPVAGYAEIALDVGVQVTPNDFLAISCDNATASFLGTSGNVSALHNSLCLTQPTAHPLPATVGTLTASTFRAPQLVGVA